MNPQVNVSQISISLQNHGAPDESGAGKSCVWMNSKDYICDSDIALILKNKPAGVKVVISGNACYSGGFADLSSSDVCTVTSASRLNVGYTQGRSFWNAISERHPKYLSDLREPIVAESGRQMLLGSQVIMQQLCQEARTKISIQDKQSFLLAKDNYGSIYNPSDCRDADITAKKLSLFSTQVLDLLQKENASCENLHLPRVACAAQNRLRKADPEIRKKIQELQSIASNDDDNFDWAIKNAESIQKSTTHFSSDENFTSLERKEIKDSIVLDIDPDWTKFNPKRVDAVKKAIQALRQFLKDFLSPNKIKL